MVTAWTSSRFKDLLCGLWPRADRRARFYRPRLEALEDRNVPSTLPVIWDGGGKTPLWTDRLNWQSDVAPVAGDDLVFPAVAAQKTNLNDFPKDTLFNSLTFSGTGYTVSGKSNRLDLGPGGIIDSVSGATGTNSYDGPILLSGVRTINVTASGSRQELGLGGVLSGIGGFIKTGAGTLTFKGLNANTFQASAFVSEGLLQLSKGGASPGAIPGFLTIIGGEVRLAADNQIADDAFVSLSSAGGVLNLNGHADTIGPLSMTGGSVVTGAGVLTVNGDVTAQAAQSGITFVSSAISGNLALGASRRIFTVGSHVPDLVIDQASGGVLIKDGGGVLELRAGHVSSIDEVDVIAGTLMVNGDLSASTAGLETNVVLQGNGTVSGQGRVLGPLATPSGAVDYLDDGSTGFTATTGWGRVTGRGFDNDIKQAKPAIVVGDQTATWTFTGLTAGLYRVYATWTGDSGHSTGAPYRILDNAILRTTAVVNQEVAPIGDSQDFGGVFQMLTGSVSIVSGILNVQLSNQVISELDGALVVADAVLIERLGGAVNTGGQGDLEIGDSTGDVSYLGIGSTFRVEFGDTAPRQLLVRGSLRIHPRLELSSTSFTAPPPLPAGSSYYYPIMSISAAPSISAGPPIDGRFENLPNNGDTIDMVVGTTRHTFSIDYGTGVVSLTYKNTATQVRDLTLSPDVIDEGDRVTLRGALTDPNRGDVLSLRVNWGDGSVQTFTDLGTKPFHFTHTYADNSPAGAPYLVRAEWFDQHGAGNFRKLFVTVNNVPPRLSLGGAEVVRAGEVMRHAGSFTDPGADTWHATVDFGDGSGVQPLAIQPGRGLLFEHRFTKPGKYHVTVTIFDDDGGQATDFFVVTVLPPQ